MAKVKMYTTPTCGFCGKAKSFFEKNNIKYKEINVSMDREGLREMRKKSGQMGVPVFDVNGTIIIGFNRQKIEKALMMNTSNE